VTPPLILGGPGSILRRVFPGLGFPGAARTLDNRDALGAMRAALLLLFSYVFLANHWVGDDAYITYRVVWNFVHGYGLTFNPDERVQAFTHPLWMFIMSGAHFVTRELFFTGTVVSWAFNLATVSVIVAWARTAWRALLPVVWLISSKAFVDYTSSGLEYPLSYFLLALFYIRYLDRPAGAPPTLGELRLAALLVSTAFLTRPDAVLLYIVPVGEMAWRSFRTRRPLQTATTLAFALAPAVLWLVFATVYYGFPLPNTYYAKVANGIPRFLMYSQGVAYVLNSIRHDPITLLTIALALAIANGPGRRAALSAALYVIYTVAIGGDFMSGRFFAMPFLVSVLIVAPRLSSWAPHVAGALLVYNLLIPIAPIKTTASYQAAWPWRSQNGIKDERGYYHQGTNVLFFSPFRELPDFVWVREGTSFRSSPEKVRVEGSIGFYGVYAGPTKFLIDTNALSDPLLAHLPVSPRLYFEFYASHFFRDLPEGYLESVATDQNLLKDPALHDYYDRLRNVTRGPIFRLSRVRDILVLNVGRYRNFHEIVDKRRPVAVSVRADNERFISDVGERDPVAGTLKSSGRAGYLEYGPGIPAKKGRYRVRWIGTVGQVPGGNVGYVEVWLGSDRCVERQPVQVPAGTPEHVLAQVDFTLAKDVRKLEYRMYVNGGVGMTLERVELYSGLAIPPQNP
jgi:arabinofuranosyltransferase